MMPMIDLEATGLNIKKKLKENGITIAFVQETLNFNTPQAIYKWFRGENLPTIDNLLILAFLLNTKVDDLLVLEQL